eukprot:365273-Chlamydomonas_euryale.AAC.10
MATLVGGSAVRSWLRCEWRLGRRRWSWAGRGAAIDAPGLAPTGWHAWNGRTRSNPRTLHPRGPLLGEKESLMGHGAAMRPSEPPYRHSSVNRNTQPRWSGL